jgi:ribosomal protein S18 acetylase RimI-like enzyme
LKKFGIKGVFLDVGINNINAQSFYERIGYKKLEVTPSQDGLFMIQQL